MGFLSKLFSGGAKEILDGASNILDKTVTNEGEKMQAKQELSEVVLSALNSLQNAQRDIIMAETKGNWLQRSWRPLLMLLFGFIVAYAKFIAPAFNLPNAELEPEFWGLMQIGVGGYVVGRSVEKISGNVTRNIDLPFVRKKDRKDLLNDTKG